jgi:flagellar basal-body rod modification protein FlgD
MNTIEQIFGSSAVAPPTVGKGSDELGQEDFLKLMIAQLKNQDPVNPADNSEFLGQIAQFRTVSGIDDMAKSFEGISSNLYAAQAMQASTLVGKEVLSSTEFATLSTGSEIDGLIESDATATNARLLIHDAAGSLVNSYDLGTVRAGAQRFSWNGLREDGEQAASGDYSITAQGLVDGELVAIPVSHFSKVESVSVDRENRNVLLHLDNGNAVSLPQVREFK